MNDRVAHSACSLARILIGEVENNFGILSGCVGSRGELRFYEFIGSVNDEKTEHFHQLD